ncbi:MAG TPA: histidine kinase [Acidimicrobiales bacterium]|nr:histidine kinase [Acidimicrobiales bacterium]
MTRRRLENALFYVALSLYAAGAIAILAMGVVAAWAHRSPDLHASLHEAGLSSGIWGRHAQAMADASHRVQPLPQLLLDYGFSLFNLALAAFLLWLRPHDRTARLLVVGMVGTAAVFNLQAHGVYEALHATSLETYLHYALHLIAAVAYTFALLSFPEGRLVPRWPKWALFALYTPLIAAVAALAFQAKGTSRTIAIIIYFGLLVPSAGVVGQAYRYRRSDDGLERQQSRLVFWTMVPAVIVSLIVLTRTGQSNAFTGFENRPIDLVPVNLFRIFQPVFAIIPVALFVGILRFRLWNIDRVISRTLLYGMLAGFVSLVYVGVVIGLGRLLGFQQHGNLGLSIVATGLIALAFEPVKERMDKLANRLVYGNRATPYEVLSELSVRMAEVDVPEALLSRLARLLGEGVGARRADVWLYIGDEARPAASWPAGGDAEPMEHATAVVPVVHQGQLLGALAISKAGNAQLSPTEAKLLSDVGAQAGLVLRNVRLTAELLARLEELRASRHRLVTAQDEARRGLERNLHDGAQQQLVALKVQLGLAERMASAGQDVSPLLHELGEAATEALENLRDLARGIYPPLLAAEGLAVALTAQGRKAPFDLSVDADGMGRYPLEVEGAVYFCCLEAFQNTSKYAEASKVTVTLRGDERHITFRVEDDGCGFDPTTTPRGSGSQNVTDRVEALDGKVTITSSPGHGTVLAGDIPIREVVAVDA